MILSIPGHQATYSKRSNALSAAKTSVLSPVLDTCLYIRSTSVWLYSDTRLIPPYDYHMSENPYAFQPEPQVATATDGLQPASDRPLHSMWSVFWATFMGTPIGGAIVIALSLARLNRTKAAWLTLLITACVFLPILIGLFFLPDDLHIPNSAFAVPQLFIMHFLAKHLYGREYKQQVAANGPISSGWKGVGIGLMTGLVFVTVGIGTILMYEDIGISELLADYGTPVEFGDDTVFVSGDATKADARKLCSYLTEQEFLGQADGGADVKLRRNGDLVTVSFVMGDGAWEDPEIVDYFQYLADELVKQGFGPPVIIEICDDTMTARETVQSGAGE
mgnify:CR=1 FL=1